MNFSAYAERIGVHVSSVSRAVADGRYPVLHVNGRKMIDVAAADQAREREKSRPRPGGSAETRAARASAWRAKVGSGFDLGQHRLLAQLTMHGPRLLALGMRASGAKDESEIARAAAVLAHLVEYAACTLHNEMNAERVSDYRTALPQPIPPDLSAETLPLYERLLSHADEVPEWPETLTDDCFDAFEPARL